jgi:DNA invertase Pin-like site-specific DNA recombinase
MYFDNTPGSKTCPRPGLKRLVADCEAGKVGLIVTNSLTMLYEDTADSLQFVWEMQILSPPVHIRLEDVGIDTRNPQALLYCMVFNFVIQEKKERAASSLAEKMAVATRLLAIEESQHKSDYIHGSPLEYMRDSFLQREEDEGGAQ